MIKEHKKNFKKYVFIFLLVFLSFVGNLKAQDNYITLDKANNEYAKGNYQNAIGLYLQIIKTGFEAPELYYNLGNAYFKANNYPSAILYFEKAKRLNPTDEDIDFNIKVTNNKIIDKIDIVPELFYIRWWKAMYSFNTTNGWAILSIISLTSLLLLTGLYLFSSKVLIRKLCFAFSFLFIVITALTLNFAFIQQKNISSSNEAVIFTPTVSVKSSPDVNSVDLFVIHEGTKIEITDNIGEWSEIRIANKSKGWIKKDCYEKI
jgi:tetratricopeptide (TPR) repeat protein